MPLALEYRAFLSYAHADSKTAADLHKRLEAFRIDKDLAGRETTLGPVPAKLRPIFRDREDFSGGHTLTDATIAALDAAAALIVLCSTVAATRPAVNEEVRLFVSRHPDRPVIPVILDGSYPDNFPPALRFEIDADGTISDRPVTRLGPDLSSEPRDLVLAKIVAGMTGLTPNEIYRREKRHQQQRARMRAAVAAVMLALAGTGGFLYWRTLEQGAVIADAAAREKEVAAMVERECAKRPQACAANPGQRQDMAAAIRSLLAQANDGDATAARIAELLRAGKTDEAIDVHVAAAEARERRAAADSKRAARDYRDAAALAATAIPGRARDLYARAARLDPDDMEGMYQHGWFQQQAGNLRDAEAAYDRVLATGKVGTHDLRLYWARLGIGDIQMARGALPAALTSYREASLLADAKAKADPGNAGWQRNLSVSHSKIGDVQVAQGDITSALLSHEATKDIMHRITLTDPDNASSQRDLSVSQEKVGDVLVARGQLPQALEIFKASLTIIDRLAKTDPGNAGWQRDLSVSHERIGRVLVLQKQLPQALDSFKAALEIRERFAKSDPANAGWKRDLALSYQHLGDALLAQARWPQALEHLKAALAILDRLREDEPGNADWQRDLSVNYHKIGDVLVAQGQLPQALDSFKASLAIADRLAKADPGNAGWQADLAVSHGKLGRLHVAMGDNAEALRLFKAGRAIVAPFAERSGHQRWIGYLKSFDADIAALEGK